MQPSPWLWNYLKARTTFRPTAARDTRHAPWTLGYGHVVLAEQVGTCSLEEGEEFLREDVAWAVEAVMACTEAPTQPQFDVLVSLVFTGEPMTVAQRARLLEAA